MKPLFRILKEPIVLFILLGIMLFIVYAGISERYLDRDRTILVSPGQIAMLEESFTKTWNRPPTGEELRAQIDNFIMDEIFYREALEMGLDQTDLAVKRRLRQIMEMMLDDYATIYPTEDQLQIYLTENPEKFRTNPEFSFRHLYFDFSEKENAEEFLRLLKQDASAANGHNKGLVMLPSEFESESQSGIERLFGTDFARQLTELAVNSWQGPVVSAYGLHLVYINQRVDGDIPGLQEIWDLVEREWTAERKQALKEEQYNILRKQYKIEVAGYVNESE